jgi:hypothetical protein
MTEQNRARMLLFNNLVKVQHREYLSMVTELHQALETDPDFISRACAHLANGGTNIRDTADCAIITLLTSPTEYPEYREAGRCLLLGDDVYDIEPQGISGVEPFRIFRIDEFIRKYQVKAPRLMRETMTAYIHFLESHPSRFDGVAIRNRKALKSVYTHYHIKPDDRAQAILFDDKPPADSKLSILKQIANSTDVREQVRLVIENKIPYVVASSVLPKMTPAVGVALIEVMSPTEALNSRGWVEKSGLLQVPEIRDAYTNKIKQATKSAASIENRKSAQGTDQGIQEAVNQAKEESVAKQQRITQNLLLMVDISGSMEAAIGVAIKFGERIAPLCDGEICVVAFNDYAREIKVTDTHSLNAWQQAFKGIRCGGYTSMQAGIELAYKNGYSPQIVVTVTDEGENRGSYADFLIKLESRGIDVPHTVCLKVGSNHILTFSQRIEDAGYRIDRFEVSGDDYYIFDQVAAILGGSPMPTIVDRILSTSLPYRVKKGEG